MQLQKQKATTMRNFAPIFFSIAFAAWLGAVFAFAMMDTNFTEWFGEFQQYYFHTKGN
jgi:TRAP-type C4-dicarboxylate transport system permease large subunit